MNCKHRPPTRCMCPDHHPGLGYIDPRNAHVLRIVTPGTPPEIAPQQDDADTVIRERRANCLACDGNPDVCQAGTGAPHFRRLAGCTAFDETGHFGPLRALPQPAQPWDPRPARRRAA